MNAFAAGNPVTEIVQDILHGSLLFKAQGGPLDAVFQQGHPESRVLLAAGENASGKSLLIRVISSFLREENTEPLQLSMRYRTMAGMHRSFMYSGLGDELNSTGAESLIGIEGGIKTATNRTEPCWLMLDEPDVGLSEGYSAALGQYLAEFGNQVPFNQCQGLVVVTHSRQLLQSMAFSLKHEPHFLCFSDLQADDLMTAWLEDERDRTVQELLSLPERSMATYRAVQDIFDKGRQSD